MARFDSADLVSTVRARGRIPANSGDWTTDNILKVVSNEAEALFPAVIASKGEYNLLTKTSSVIDGTERYRIHKRAFDNALREVWLQDSDGARLKITELSSEELTDLRANPGDSGTPEHFWIDDGVIRLYPTPDESSRWTLYQRFHPRPSLLAQSTSWHPISAIDTATGRVSFATTLPTALRTAGLSYDFVRSSSPYSIMEVDVGGAVDAAFLYIDFSPSALPADLAVGDYVALTGTTPFLNMPESLALPAALYAAAAIITPQGDDNLAAKLRKEADAKVLAAMVALTPRTKAPTKKLNNRRWF